MEKKSRYYLTIYDKVKGGERLDKKEQKIWEDYQDSLKI